MTDASMKAVGDSHPIRSDDDAALINLCISEFKAQPEPKWWTMFLPRPGLGVMVGHSQYHVRYHD